MRRIFHRCICVLVALQITLTPVAAAEPTVAVAVAVSSVTSGADELRHDVGSAGSRAGGGE